MGRWRRAWPGSRWGPERHIEAFRLNPRGARLAAVLWVLAGTAALWTAAALGFDVAGLDHVAHPSTLRRAVADASATLILVGPPGSGSGPVGTSST